MLRSSNFSKVSDLSTPELYDELLRLMNEKGLTWGKQNQICLNSIPGKTDDPYYGVGSLILDWNNHRVEGNAISVDKREVPLREEDFTELCDVFVGTKFEKVYQELFVNYDIGRVRLMMLPPRKCLSWHTDNTQRLHYPIKTQEGCFMVIEDEIKHLEKNTWWMTYTLRPHNVFNGSNEDRIHLVASIL